MAKSFLLLLGVLQAFAVLAGAGPRLSSRAFFSEHVKLDSPGLEGVRAAVAQDDFAGAERAFGAFVRGYLAKRAAASRESRVTDPERIAVLKERAERTMDNEFVVCRTPYRFADGKIDWEFNPTYNGYKEWTYQFSRHEFLIDLADYYLATGDERAAESYVRILSSWLDQAQVPLAASPYDTHCWRTIEAGLRMMPECWVHQLEAFVSSPAVTDAFLTAYFRSVCEHGWRLANNPTTGNWFAHQLLGLASISINYPFLADAPKWREYSVGRFAEQLRAQVYPDGFQYELSTGYHLIVLRSYLELAKVFEKSGEPVPAFIGEAVRPMVGALVALRRPDGQTPPLNDGGCVGVDGVVRSARAFLSKDFRFPLDVSTVLPYSGAVTFRSGGGAEDVWGYLDAGPLGRAHQHEDKLSFLLSAYGRNMVVEAGTYDYDESEMRRYVVSTRAHNTVLFDGLCQNRYAGGEWKNPNLKKKADMEFFTSPGCDAAEAKFDEGYGPTRQGFTHARKVLFRRDVEGMTPFFVIVDRLTASDDKPHRFEIPWHLEECALRLARNGFKADFGEGVGLVGAISDVGVKWNDRCGSLMPDYQGWLPIRKGGPHEHRPVPTPVAEGCFTGSVRVVTVLYPYENDSCPLRAVAASSDPEDDRYVMRLADGRMVEQSESVIPAPLVFEVKTDRPDALYACGEKATFHVTVCWTNGLRATTGRVIAKLDDTGTNSVSRQAFDLLENNPFRVEGTLGSPGFLRLTLQARGTSPKCWSAGYEPEKIVKGSPSPTDFDDFWREARAKLAREVPLDPQVEKVPERSKPGFDFYRISFATFGRRVYGFLSIPTDRTKAPYPVRVQVSAAGFGGWTNEMSGNADEIRAFFAVMPWAPDFDWAKKGLMSNYHAMNDGYVKRYGCKYQQAGISESREAYFFYPVLLGIDRAVDWIAARPDVDPKRFCYYGVSQGGGFGFYLCALNRHFTHGAVFVPALTDILGYRAGRLSGWPTLIEEQRPENRAEAERNAPYFDAANFASRICCPFLTVVGFSDTTCPPSAVYAAYNEIPGINKRILHGLGMSHHVNGRFAREVEEFLAGENEKTAKRPDVLAIYYPHWHVYPKGDEWFHPGWTEWEYVRDSPARFPGHRQPLVPLHGYLDGKNPKDVAKEIDLAADAGIDVFLYDYYYYNGEVTQEEALEQGFLKAPNRARMKFAIMWCYHDRGMAWRPSEKTAERRKLMVHDGTPEEFLGLIDLCIERYFPRPEHYRKNGALYFSFYNPWGFIEKVGRDKAKAAFAEARRRVRAAGLGEIHFNGQGGKIENTALMEDVGFDSLTDYAFGVFALAEYEERRDRGEWLYDFGAIGQQLEASWRKKGAGPLPYYPIVPTGWDTSARMKPEVKMPVLGPGADYPYTGIYTNATARHFGRYLDMAKRFVTDDPKADLVQINAWNEYTEGCWLVPDNFEGDEKLRAIEQTFGCKPGKGTNR